MRILMVSLVGLATVVAILHAQDAPATGAIYGEIFNEKQEVIGGAEIEVVAGPGSVGTKAISRGPESVIYDGGFFIADLLPGLYKVQVSHKNYLPQTFEKLKVTAGRGTFIVAELRSLAEVTGEIAGSVIVRGASLEGVLIGYVKEGEKESEQTVVLKADGVFSFTQVMPGTYVLVVIKDKGEVYRSEPITVEEKKTRRKTIRLKPEMLLAKPGWITGKVTGPDRKPVSGATITLVKMPEGQRKVTARSGDGGKYEMKGLRPGSYQLRASRGTAEDIERTNVRSERGSHVNFRLKEKK